MAVEVRAGLAESERNWRISLRFWRRLWNGAAVLFSSGCDVVAAVISSAGATSELSTASLRPTNIALALTKEALARAAL
jgi:hypothetical protein